LKSKLISIIKRKRKRRKITMKEKIIKPSTPTKLGCRVRLDTRLSPPVWFYTKRNHPIEAYFYVNFGGAICCTMTDKSRDKIKYWSPRFDTAENAAKFCELAVWHTVDITKLSKKIKNGEARK
jgi:hypothetical protein